MYTGWLSVLRVLRYEDLQLGIVCFLHVSPGLAAQWGRSQHSPGITALSRGTSRYGTCFPHPSFPCSSDLRENTYQPTYFPGEWEERQEIYSIAMGQLSFTSMEMNQIPTSTQGMENRGLYCLKYSVRPITTLLPGAKSL